MAQREPAQVRTRASRQRSLPAPRSGVRRELRATRCVSMASRMLVVTTGSLTAAARKLAASNEVDLWDRDQLERKLVAAGPAALGHAPTSVVPSLAAASSASAPSPAPLRSGHACAGEPPRFILGLLRVPSLPGYATSLTTRWACVDTTCSERSVVSEAWKEVRRRPAPLPPGPRRGRRLPASRRSPSPPRLPPP